MDIFVFRIYTLLGRKETFLVFFVPGFLVLGFLTIFTHFIAIIPLTFLWGFLWIRKEDWPFSNLVSIVLTSLLSLIVIAKFYFVRASGYDAPNIHKATHFSFNDVLNSLGPVW